VSRIIDETSRKMLRFSNDCIILEDVVCRGRHNAGLSFCPRANYPYWRELWLERVNPPDASPDATSGISGIGHDHSLAPQNEIAECGE
jgi:hypothetical protein